MQRAFQFLALSCFGFAAADEQDSTLPRTEVEALREAEGRLTGIGDSSLIPETTLRESAVPSLAELLRIEAGLPTPSFFGSAGTGVPVIRGFAENASARTLILVDGLPVNRPDLAAPAWFEFPLAGLSQVEVSRGSRTVRYGSAAMAGVIALETRRDEAEPSFNFESAFGSDGTRILRTRFSQPLESGWQFDLGAESQMTDGWRDHSGFEAESIQLSLSSPSDRPFSQRWVISHSDFDFENPGGLTEARYRDNPRQSIYQEFGVEDDFRNRNRSNRIANQMVWQPKGGIRHEQNISVLQRERWLNFGAGSHTNQDIRTLNFESVHTREFDSFQLQLGLRSQFDDFQLDRFRERSRDARVAEADLERFTVGAFALGSWQIDDQWKFSSGASWDHFRVEARSNDLIDATQSFDGKSDEGGFAFEAALEYTPAESWTSWIRYDRLFRFPVLDEIAGYQGFVLSTPFNAGLEPERGNAFELGSRYEADAWSAGSTAFWVQLDNEILFDFVANENRNFGQTRRYGVESFIRCESANWRAQLRHSFTRAEFTDGPFAGNRLPLVAEHSLSASLAWQPTDPLLFQLEADFLSASPEGNDFANRRSELPERLLINCLTRWAINEQTSLFFRVNNLFDERYASLKFSGQWYPGAGRQYLAGLQLDF